MTTAISGSSSTNSSTSAPASKGMGDLNSSDFIKLMIAQLQQQDPLDPTKSDQILTQLSQIKSLQSNDKLNTTLSGMTLQQSLNAGASLIGKTVKGKDDSGSDVEGLVASVKKNGDKYYLELDTGKALPLEAVTGVYPPVTPTK